MAEIKSQKIPPPMAAAGLLGPELVQAKTQAKFFLLNCHPAGSTRTTRTAGEGRET